MASLIVDSILNTPPIRAVHASTATESSREEEVVQLWDGLTVFEMVRDNTQRERLRVGQRFVSGGAVSESTREIDDLGEPAAVVLLVKLNLE